MSDNTRIETLQADRDNLRRTISGARRLVLADPGPRWDFDLISFSSAASFENLLDRHGLTEYIRVDQDSDYYDTRYAFVWYNPETGLLLQTKNNPITGQYSIPADRPSEKGYASYMAIEGPSEAAKQLAVDITLTADHVKSGGKEAGYSDISETVRTAVASDADRATVGCPA
jgi:hypothetical protein